MTILRIDASGRHEGSITRRLTDRIVARLGGEVVTRDLTRTPPAHVDGGTITAYFTTPADRTSPQLELLRESNAVVAELKAADTIVIGAPVYNFGVPAALKAWADQAARVGKTFRYTEAGPKGLLEGKRAIVAVASGGTPVGGEVDFATPWLRFFLGFIGITDVTFVVADGLGAGAEAKIAEAEAAIDALPLDAEVRAA